MYVLPGSKKLYGRIPVVSHVYTGPPISSRPAGSPLAQEDGHLARIASIASVLAD